MRSLPKAFAFIFTLPLLCAGTLAVLSYTAVYLAALQLPAWAQGPVIAWMLGEGDEAAGENASLPASAAIPLDGYRGPESFACLLPPAYGYLTDRFGTLRRGGWVHYGIDYGTYYRSVPVRTPFGGKVVFAGWQGAYGYLLVIENAGYRVYLAHNEQLLAAAGQVVEAGDTVALSGSTGNSSGYHVHFEVRIWDGAAWRPVDPNLVALPGQSVPCGWYDLGSAPPPEP